MISDQVRIRDCKQYGNVSMFCYSRQIAIVRWMVNGIGPGLRYPIVGSSAALWYAILVRGNVTTLVGISIAMWCDILVRGNVTPL